MVVVVVVVVVVCGGGGGGGGDDDDDCNKHSNTTVPNNNHKMNTCNKSRIMIKHVNFPSAIAARRLVVHPVDISEQQAHVCPHLHRHQRCEAVVVAECVAKNLR